MGNEVLPCPPPHASAKPATAVGCITLKSHTDQETVRIEIPMGNTQWAKCDAAALADWQHSLLASYVIGYG